MIVVIDAETARLVEPHDYTNLRVIRQGARDDHAVALARSGLGGVDGDRVSLDIAGLARALRAANAHSERWFDAMIVCAGAWGWVRYGSDLVQQSSAASES